MPVNMSYVTAGVIFGGLLFIIGATFWRSGDLLEFVRLNLGVTRRQGILIAVFGVVTASAPVVAGESGVTSPSMAFAGWILYGTGIVGVVLAWKQYRQYTAFTAARAYSEIGVSTGAVEHGIVVSGTATTDNEPVSAGAEDTPAVYSQALVVPEVTYSFFSSFIGTVLTSDSTQFTVDGTGREPVTVVPDGPQAFSALTDVSEVTGPDYPAVVDHVAPEEPTVQDAVEDGESIWILEETVADGGEVTVLGEPQRGKHGEVVVPTAPQALQPQHTADKERGPVVFPGTYDEVKDMLFRSAYGVGAVSVGAIILGYGSLWVSGLNIPWFF